MSVLDSLAGSSKNKDELIPPGKCDPLSLINVNRNIPLPYAQNINRGKVKSFKSVLCLVSEKRATIDSVIGAAE